LHVARTGGEERCIQGFGWERDHLGDPGVDGRAILKWILRNGIWVGGGVNAWFDLVQDRDRWQALENGVKNFRFHKMRGIS